MKKKHKITYSIFFLLLTVVSKKIIYIKNMKKHVKKNSVFLFFVHNNPINVLRGHNPPIGHFDGLFSRKRALNFCRWVAGLQVGG